MLRVDFAKSLNTTWPKNETWRKKRKELNYRGKTSFIHCDKKLQAVIFLTNSQVAKCLIKVLPMFISKKCDDLTSNKSVAGLKVRLLLADTCWNAMEINTCMPTLLLAFMGPSSHHF